MKILVKIVFVVFILNACKQAQPPDHASLSKEKPKPPPAEVDAICTHFPGSVPYREGIDSLLVHLKTFGIADSSLLWGQSTCVDDITNTKNHFIPWIKGPFNFGGLAGLPFTGITGLSAFSHHVPENGTALLFVGPHVGYSEKEGWGKILRHGQLKSSSCCGALVAALAKLQKGEPGPEFPREEDYQEDVIIKLAMEHKEEILSSKWPLIALTQFVYREAERQMTQYASGVKERHFRYAVIVGAVIINTDHMYTDYLWIEDVSILDVYQNKWLQGRRWSRVIQ